MDITSFITWFVQQVVNIFTKVFTILDNIQFAGTSLLKFTLAIVVLSALIPILLTVGQSAYSVSTRSERIRDRRSKNREGDSND